MSAALAANPAAGPAKARRADGRPADTPPGDADAATDAQTDGACREPAIRAVRSYRMPPGSPRRTWPSSAGKRAGPVVAVTGAAHGLGLALTARLAESAQVGRVVAIDDHRGDVTGVTWRVVDVRDPVLAGRLAASTSSCTPIST